MGQGQSVEGQTLAIGFGRGAYASRVWVWVSRPDPRGPFSALRVIRNDTRVKSQWTRTGRDACLRRKASAGRARFHTRDAYAPLAVLQVSFVRPFQQDRPMRFFGLSWLLASVVVCSVWADSLPGTQPLTGTNDFAAAMVDGLSRYLDRATAASVTNRQSWWRFDTSSGEAFLRSMLLTAETNRARLREILGVGDARTPPNLRFTAPLGTDAVVGGVTEGI